jgi:monoamine oxidase
MPSNGLNRRQMIVAMSTSLATTLAAPVIHRAFAAGEGEADIAVIGAGAAGIAAARHGIAAGRRVIVLEARNRIGGRAYTEHALGMPYDAGAAYVHFIKRNPWVGFARELGVTLEPWRGFQHFRPYVGGRPLGEDAIRQRRRARELFWDFLGDIPRRKDDPAIADMIRSLSPQGIAAIGDMSRLALGEDPERVSTRDYMRLWDGDDVIVPEGYGTLVEKMGQGLPVHLDTPVQSIAWDGTGVAIGTARGTLRARAVIVTVSLGVLAAGHIRFEPGLPNETLAAIDGMRMGALTKCVLALDGERFGIGRNEDMIALDYPGGSMTFEMWPFDRNLVIATTGGDAARALIAQGEAGAIETATATLASLIGGAVRGHVIGGKLSAWWGDPFAEGSYAVVKPGHIGARAALARPVGERIWFAGEATAGGQLGAAMTVAGATFAGEQAAREALALFDR